jgi:hypothetical protein
MVNKFLEEYKFSANGVEDDERLKPKQKMVYQIFLL